MITNQDLANMQITQGIITNEQIIKELIQTHDTTDMETGDAYYHNKNDIKKRQIYYYLNEVKQVDKDATNHRIPHNFHKLLVDQKVSYLLGKPIVITATPPLYEQTLNERLDEKWDDVLQEIGKNASNKGVEYLHPYITPEGDFDYVVIPAEQAIPIYETEYEKDLVYFLRYYPFIVNGRETARAEWWDKEQVTFYIRNGSGLFEMELPEEGKTNPESHFYYNNSGYGWKAVPFIAFKNNEEKYGDLKYYKEIIDIYDLINSDVSNDLTDIQKLIYILKGYAGTSLDEFMHNIRRYKAIKVDGGDGTGVDTLSATVQIEAIDSFLDRLEENIFLFGQGINMKSDKFGNSPSGIALKFLYSLLDLKSNIMARKFSFAIKNFTWFLTEYLALSNKGVYDNSTVKITFTKSMLINDKEMVEIGLQSKGIISDETIISNHPWVENTGEEQERIKAEREDTVDLDLENGEE